MSSPEDLPALFLELKLAGGLVQKFPTADSFRVWLEEEWEYWQWMWPTTTTQNIEVGCAQVSRDLYRAFFDSSRVALQNPTHAAPLIRSAADRLSPNGPILRPSADAIFIEQLRDRLRSRGLDAEVTGVCAVLMAASIPPWRAVDLRNFANPICFEAFAYMSAAREGSTGGGKIAIDRAVNDARQSLTNINASAEQRLALMEKVGRSEFDRFSIDNANLQNFLRSAVDEAIDRIDKTRDLYRKSMQLKAPVEYWTDKATEHKIGVVTYRRWLTGSALAVLLVLLATYGLGWWALNHASKSNASSPLALTLYVAGFVAAITALLLWFVRIVVRLYMSQHHLTVDADERAAMLKTFLALTEDSKVSEKDLALILAAVFRPTPDGIIRDDGAPAMSPGGLFALLLDRK